MHTRTKIDFIKKANEFFGVDLKTRCRERRFVVPRRMAIALLRDHFDLSWSDISEMVGNFDHSTGIHHYKAHQDALSMAWIKEYAWYKERYESFCRYMDDLMSIDNERHTLKQWAFQLTEAINAGASDQEIVVIVGKIKEIENELM